MAESTGSRLTSDDDFWDTKPTKCQTCDNNFGGVSIWCEEDNFWKFIHNVREGDRLELVNSNLLCPHSWAIYVGKWNLPWCAVQVFNPDNEEGGAYAKRKTSLGVSFPASKDVIVTSISWFLINPGGEVRINNLKDNDWSPLDGEHIFKEVTYQLQELHDSPIIDEQVCRYVSRNQFKDSEDFVNFCRYDRDCQHKRRINNCEMVSNWYSKTDIEGFIREVRVGDRLEFKYNSPNECWGIYIGQWGNDLDQVVLFALGDKTNSATSTEKPKPKLWVTSIQIYVVDGDEQVRINNEGDRKWPPLDREDILKEISHQLSSRADMQYECKVSFKDSEDFVNYIYCRYDRINFRIVSPWCAFGNVCVGDRLAFNRNARPYMHWVSTSVTGGQNHFQC